MYIYTKSHDLQYNLRRAVQTLSFKTEPHLVAPDTTNTHSSPTRTPTPTSAHTHTPGDGWADGYYTGVGESEIRNRFSADGFYDVIYCTTSRSTNFGYMQHYFRVKRVSKGVSAKMKS